MILTEVDIKIIDFMYDCALKGIPLTISSIARGIYEEGKSQRFYDSKAVIAIYHLEKLHEEGLVEIEKVKLGKKTFKNYNLDGKRVLRCPHKFPDKKIKNCIAVQDKENKWLVVEI